jgi:hypothetical protein
MLSVFAGLKAGDWVEVKSKEAILATLDHNGSLDGMPFMPEMLAYCGQRFEVFKRAHKTCDFSKGMDSRRLENAVHLRDLRCDGSAHGGCQAECMFYWNEAWLTPSSGSGQQDAGAGNGHHAVREAHSQLGTPVCSEATLHAATRDRSSSDELYACQMTRVLEFTEPLPWWHLDQYLEAVVSRNVSLTELVPPLAFRVFERVVQTRLGGSRLRLRDLYDRFQQMRGGTPYPNRQGVIPIGGKTPRGDALNLQPGEYARVKSLPEILETLDGEGKNRGLIFAQEMVPHCGKVYRVHRRVERIIDERTAKMVNFKSDCIMLENVYCEARYNKGLSFCPRRTYGYWREIWLERATAADQAAQLPTS